MKEGPLVNYMLCNTVYPDTQEIRRSGAGNDLLVMECMLVAVVRIEWWTDGDQLTVKWFCYLM